MKVGGSQEWLESGIEGVQQELQHQRLTVQRLVRAKFPALESLAVEQAARIADSEQLQDVIVHMGLAQTEEEAHKYLSEASKSVRD